MQTMWAVGAETKNRGFDHIIKAKSWEYAFEKLEKIRNKHDIEWIEFWGHGAEGEAFIGSDCLDLERFEELCDEHNIKASDMKHGRKYTPLIWFRTCNTASGEAGEEFLRGIADKLNVNAYAHNQTIHLDQNGVCCARRDGTYDENCAKRTKHLFSIYPE